MKKLNETVGLTIIGVAIILAILLLIGLYGCSPRKKTVVVPVQSEGYYDGYRTWIDSPLAIWCDQDSTHPTSMGVFIRNDTVFTPLARRKACYIIHILPKFDSAYKVSNHY